MKMLVTLKDVGGAAAASETRRVLRMKQSRKGSLSSMFSVPSAQFQESHVTSVRLEQPPKEM